MDREPPPRTQGELDERASRPTEEVQDTLRRLAGDVLVLGAGGKMGLHLSLLLERGLRAIGSTRRVLAVSRFGASGATARFAAHGIATHSADLLDRRALAALPEADAVFFLAGKKFGTNGDVSSLERWNVELPRRVAERFRDARIVALSTGCVYAFTRPESGGSLETDPLDPPGEYARSCIGRERAFAESGARTCLVRLNYSVDLRYGVLVDLAQAVLADEPIDVSTGRFNVIWQGDANTALVRALELAASPPFVLNLTGSRILSVREVANTLGRRLGRRVQFRGQEAGTAWLSNSAKARALFGAPRVDEDTLIEWVATWLESGGELLGKPTMFQVRDGRYGTEAKERS